MRTQAVWLFRILWFLLPLTLGRAAGDAIASADHAVPRTMTIGLWILWAIVVIASMVPLPITLTAMRVIAPGAVPLAIWAMFDTEFGGIAIVAAGHAIATAVVALNQLVGDVFADGGSYGDERRMLLRPPGQIGFALAPLVWALMVAGVAAGPLLLANQSWLVGVIATVVGAVALVVGGRALHQLTQRWIVFVPTGMVLHDLMALTEPVLFRRTAIERLGAAIDGSPARDLSNNAPGLLLECELTDPAPLGLRSSAGAEAKLTDVRRFLFCPSRPGALLDEAERRNIATD
jgi:hypothetical protein